MSDSSIRSGLLSTLTVTRFKQVFKVNYNKKYLKSCRKQLAYRCLKIHFSCKPQLTKFFQPLRLLPRHILLLKLDALCWISRDFNKNETEAEKLDFMRRKKLSLYKLITRRKNSLRPVNESKKSLLMGLNCCGRASF